MNFVKIVVGGIEVWVPENEQEAARARIEREVQARVNSAVQAREQELVSEHSAERDRLQARVDDQAEQIEQLSAGPGEEEIQTRVNAAVNAEVQERVQEVARLLPLFDGQVQLTRNNSAGQTEQVSLYGLGREELLRAAILTRRPNAKLEGKGLGYLEERVEALLEHKATSDHSSQTLNNATETARANARDGGAQDVIKERDAARAEAVAHMERRAS